jgi:GDP-L-fucose synthase
MGYWQGKRVLVTGGGGFLGSHLVDKLSEAGCERVIVVRHREHDLTSQVATARLFQEAGPLDTVFHLAGLVGGIGANQARPADYCYQNLMMGLFTMHEAWRSGAGQLVAAGAGCGYPEKAPLPLAESSFWEGFPQRESAPYSLAKRMLHIQAVAYFAQHRFPAVIAIPGNVYGPRDNFDLEEAHVVPALVRKFADAVERKVEQVVLWGSGTPSRDFVFAGDVAEGLLSAAETYREPHLVNLSSGRETSIREVAEILARLSGFSGDLVWDPARPDGQERRVFDVGKARRDLGWTARTSLEDGLRQTLDWYRTNRATARTQRAA